MTYRLLRSDGLAASPCYHSKHKPAIEHDDETGLFRVVCPDPDCGVCTDEHTAKEAALKEWEETNRDILQ